MLAKGQEFPDENNAKMFAATLFDSYLMIHHVNPSRKISSRMS